MHRTKIERWTLQYNDFDVTCVYLQYVEFHMRLFLKIRIVLLFCRIKYSFCVTCVSLTDHFKLFPYIINTNQYHHRKEHSKTPPKSIKIKKFKNLSLTSFCENTAELSRYSSEWRYYFCQKCWFSAKKCWGKQS